MVEGKDFLNNLVGSWELTGQMGETPLRQNVECRWSLGGLYVEMRFKSTLPASQDQLPYEAVYFIGYNPVSDRYVMHLLDTSGVPLICTVGIGLQEANAIPFVFEYEGGPFTNRFVWDSQNQIWRFELTFLQDGQERVFAVKAMRRV